MLEIHQTVSTLKLKTDSWKEYVRNVMAKFDEMSPTKMKVKLTKETLCWKKRPSLRYVMEGDTEKAVKVLEVIGIYDTYSFEGGLRLKISWFNHSCWPNAMPILNTKLEQHMTSKLVKKSQSINYRLIIFSVHIFFPLKGTK